MYMEKSNDIFKFYPAPKYDKIIEPFGFPVFYSLLYPEKKILINDFKIESKELLELPDAKMVDWEISIKPYYNLVNEEATWFVNPPRDGSLSLDFCARWCKTRRGQVIVPGNVKEKWLNFKEILDGQGFWSNFSTKITRTQLKLWT